jgi:hypothetical protein
MGWARRGDSLTACNGGDDTDFVTVLEGGLLILEETNVLLIDIDIHETTDGAVFIEESIADAWVTGLQFGESSADVVGIDFDEFLVVGQFAEGRGDADLRGHSSKMGVGLSFRFQQGIEFAQARSNFPGPLGMAAHGIDGFESVSRDTKNDGIIGRNLS